MSTAMTVSAPTKDALIQSPVSDEQREQVVKRVKELSTDLTTMKPHSPEWAKRSEELAMIGKDNVYATTAAADRLLDKSLKDMKSTDSSGAKVSKSLIDLRDKMEDIDPNGVRTLPGFLDKLPIIGGGMKRYVQQFEPAKKQINLVVNSLYHGKDELIRDNSAIDMERTQMWEAMDNLKGDIEVARAITEQIEADIAAIRPDDPERARQMEKDMLHPAIQRQNDLTTHLMVTAQSYIALEVISENNKELIKGVDRAANTTVAALSAAVMVNGALQTQETVIRQIDSVNKTTNAMILSTSKRVKTQTDEIATQAMTSSVDMSSLKEAFTNCFEAMQSLEQSKANGIVKMKSAIAELDGQMGQLGKVHNKMKQLEAAKIDLAESEVIEGTLAEAEAAVAAEDAAAAAATQAADSDADVVDVDADEVEVEDAPEATDAA